MYRFLVLALALLLSACAPMTLTKENEQQIRSVAVVSAIPETAALTKIGLTVFNNEKGEIDMKGQIKETLASVTARRLAQTRPNWTVKEIHYDLPELIGKLRSPGMVMSSSVEKIQKDLGELARKNGVDAILVFAPAEYDSMPGSGAGVLLRTLSLTSIGQAFAHGYVSLSVVSPEGKMLADAGHGFNMEVRPISPKAYGIKYALAENLRPEVTDKLAAAIREVLADNARVRFTELGM